MIEKNSCNHFKVGTNVAMGRGRRGTVLRADVSDGETVLCVTWTDGSISLVRPYALNR